MRKIKYSQYKLVPTNRNNLPPRTYLTGTTVIIRLLQIFLLPPIRNFEIHVLPIRGRHSSKPSGVKRLVMRAKGKWQIGLLVRLSPALFFPLFSPCLQRHNTKESVSQTRDKQRWQTSTQQSHVLTVCNISQLPS